MVNKTLSRVMRVAREEGRVCSRCGWIITKKNWAKGYRLCGGCYSAMKGVNCKGGWGAWFDEPRDKTGEML